MTRAPRELSRSIRPGGALVISDLRPHTEEWLREEHADLRLGLEADREILIAPDAEGFGRAVLRLLEDAGERRKLAEAGRRRVEEKFDWRKLAARQLQLYDELLSSARP